VILRYPRFLFCGLAFMLTACGSISTKTLQATSGPAPRLRVEKIVVLPFDSKDCIWGLEVSAAVESAIKNDFPERLATAFVQELQQVAPTSKAQAGEGENTWLVQGRIHRVLLPDPALKDSKRRPLVECTVFVFDPSRSLVQPFLTYSIVAKEVFPDPLADSSESIGDEVYLALEAKESARLLKQSLQDYIKSRGWPEKL
jgi:hypothetical protein